MTCETCHFRNKFNVQNFSPESAWLRLDVCVQVVGLNVHPVDSISNCAHLLRVGLANRWSCSCSCSNFYSYFCSSFVHPVTPGWPLRPPWTPTPPGPTLYSRSTCRYTPRSSSAWGPDQRGYCSLAKLEDSKALKRIMIRSCLRVKFMIKLIGRN